MFNQPSRLPVQHCVVCAAPLARSFGGAARGPDPYPSCQAIGCRMVVSRREEMGEAGFRHYLQTQSRQRQFHAAALHAAAERKLAEDRENAAAWQALRGRLPAGLTPEPLALLVPSGPRRASRLAALRRARYRAHLLQIIDEADGFVGPVAAAAPAVDGASAMPGRLCAMCGGGCCTKGGDQAYLSAATMRRFMEAQPALSKQEVAAAYLACVSGKTQAGSCINHTGQGCSLPKEMRSDTCNRFSCASLARLEAAQRGPAGVQAVLVVRRKQDHWNREQAGVDNAVTGLALLRETGTTRLVAPPGLYTTAAAIASKVS